MGHNALFVMLGAFLIYGILTYHSRMNVKNADEHLAHYLIKAQARDLAQTGLNLSVRKLSADQNPWINGHAYSYPHTEYSTGTFTTTVIPIGTSGNVVDIVAVGIQKYITQGGVPRDTSHTIQTRYARNEEAAMLSLMDLSRYVDNVIVTQKTLDIRGNVFIGPFNKVEPVNSNVHTNGVLRTEGNSYEVQGFGTYAGSEEVNFDRFAPNDDVNGSASNVYQVDPLRIPRLNLNQLRANASLHYITGDFTINAADFPYVSFDAWALALGAPPQTGTPEGDPFILVVEGDLNLVNLVRLDGHGILAAAGNIRFGKGKGGGGHAGIIGETANYESLLGLYTVGDIEVAGNAELAATLYADGNISFGGTLDLIGGIYASEMEFKVHGNPSILHVRAKDSILYPWFANQPSPNPVRITSSEW